MLQSIRDRLTGPIVWFVIGLIGIPFAFWGIQSFDGGGGDPVVVSVGDHDITQTQFRQAYDQRYQQYRALLGQSFRADLFDEARFRQLTLDDMVQESAMRQYSRSEGYRASDATLRDFLVSIPAFQKDGKFSADTYRELLLRQGLKPDRYEAQLRESLVIDQLRGAVQETAFVTAAESWDAYRLERQTRRIAVVPVPAKEFRDKISVSDAQIAERYETDKARHQSPERIRLAYVELDRSRLAPAEIPPPEALRTLYDQEKDARFASTEERRARHILIGFGADKEAARKRVEALIAQLRNGGDFAKLAQEHSEDSDSRTKGGDLGWVRKGTMVPKFEDALFGLKSGEIAGPVETEFGWHAIRLDEIKPAAVRPFEDPGVQAELIEAYRGREGDKRFREMSAKLEQLAFENTALEPVATELGLKIATTDWFTRAGGTGIAALDAVKQAAFSPEVIQDGANSKPLVASADALVVIHKAEYEPARQLSLEEVRESLRDVLVAEGAAKLAREAAEALLAEVRAGKTLADAAQARGLAVQFEGEARRGQAQLDAPVVEAAFRMPRPEQGKTEARVVENGSREVFVVALSAVNDPPRPEQADKSYADEQARLRESVAGAEFSAYRKAIENEVKVKRVNAPETAAQNPEQ